MIRLRIDEATPSLNTCKWKHWSYHLKLRKHWSTLVMIAKIRNNGTLIAPAHACVTVTRYGKRSLDHDNFIGGCKPLLDALKDHGLILDDDAAHMTLTGVQMPLVKGDSPGTLVEIS